MAYQPAQQLRLYRNFKALDAANHHGIIRYFEQYEDQLRTLDESEYFDCAYTYAEALFAVGYYGQALVMYDHLLELVILQNIALWGGQDVFAYLLRRKAMVLMQQRQWARAEHVLREYAKMYPSDRYAWRLLKRCLLQQRPPWLARCWAVCMGFLSLSLVAAAAELFVVRPFFRPYDEIAAALHHFFLALALLTALGGEGWHWYRCQRDVRTFAQAIRARRNA